MNDSLFIKKAEFIAALEKAIVLDDRSNVTDIVIRHIPKREEEIITVFFRGGGIKEIVATYNSNYANAKAILEAVYE